MSMISTCVITASDEAQAKLFRDLLARRLDKGLYPREIDFRIYADPPAGRLGSGGGTIWALDRLLDDSGAESALERDSFLAGRSILVMHAGGQSRRLPPYVPEGKLFAPVPAPSSSVLSPVILDLELSLFLRYPWREGEIVVTSGDVIVDFSTELLDLPDGPLCGFAAPESFERGSRHGVYSFDPLSGAVRDFHQKATPEFLSGSARIDGTESCAVDLGIVSFRGPAVLALLNFLEETDGGVSIRKSLSSGGLSFDLYVEILSAALDYLDLEAYLARIAPQSRMPKETATALYRLIHPCGLAGVLVKNPSFIHFGSLEEFPASCREMRARGLLPFYALAREELLPVVTERLILSNTEAVDISVKVGDVYAENCARVRLSCEGGNMLTGLRDFSLDETLPGGFCIDERQLVERHSDERQLVENSLIERQLVDKLSNERRLKDSVVGDKPTAVRLVFHRGDSFRPASKTSTIMFCGISLVGWLSQRGLALEEIFPRGEITASEPGDLYEAALFVPGAEASFLSGYWRLPGDLPAWVKRFRDSRRLSIAEANARSDAVRRDEERRSLRVPALRSAVLRSGISSIQIGDFIEIFGGEAVPPSLEEAWRVTGDPLLKEYRGVLLTAAGSKVAATGERRLGLSFAGRNRPHRLRCSIKADQIVWARAPLRLDLAGGWTDTPPYTNRYGGSVVNIAVDLNGQPPVQVFVRRSQEALLRFHSIDLGITETLSNLGSLRDYRDPAGVFSLPRAALCLLGLGAGEGDSGPLGPIMETTGGGLELTLLCAVPKGSGLGTSSILAGAILAALGRFFGLERSPDDLYLDVLELEQMLTTGGGWQDQIGGLIGGVKYAESRPALLPRLAIHQLDSWLFEDRESRSSMTLFYTGVTRLARNILSEVVTRVDGMDRAFLFTHSRIRELAREARDAISLRDRSRLARVVDESFRENKLIHASTSNEEIDALIAAASPHIAGMKLLGAGGGGYALFISPNPREAEALREIIARRFENDRARLVDFCLDKAGLEVTVS